MVPPITQTPNMEALTDVAAVFANPTRARLIQRLLISPCIVNDLVAATGLEQAVVSKQIGILRHSGLLLCHPEGRCRQYRLAHPDLVQVLWNTLSRLAGLNSENLQNCPKAEDSLVKQHTR